MHPENKFSRMKLTEVKNDECVFIAQIEGSGSFRARLGEMGFVKGQQIKRLFASPVGNPIVFEIMGSKVALRSQEAASIDVVYHTEEIPDSESVSSSIKASESSFQIKNKTAHCHCESKKKVQATFEHTHDVVTLALVGNPNCGKTSLFNAASGGHERTGNYSGVTVSSVIGNIEFKGRKIRFVDLPGTYSLRAFSPEEAYVAHELESGKIDAVINVLDATNLERNLLLTMQLKERNLPLIGALNMFDEVEKSQSFVDIPALEEKLGMRLIPTVARSKRGIDTLIEEAVKLADQQQASCVENRSCTHDKPKECQHSFETPTTEHHEACPCKQREEDDAVRYARIRTLLQGVYQRKKGKADQTTTLLDRIFASKWIAYPMFFVLMWFIFWATFVIGAYPSDWIDQGISWVGGMLEGNMGEGPLRDLIIDGIIGGVGSVIVFLPNILILYFFITILEDSGYLARASMLADPILNRLGLHGKSFIPMLMGFGCNVPAVMATRTIENHKSRLVTMLVIPMMSCSARIPVYVVFAGAFFAAYASWVMFGLYLFGLLMAVLVAWVFNRIYHPEQDTHFVMEIPPYRLPNWKGVFRHTWEKGRQYLHKMGGIILVASIVIWALGYFPRPDREMSPAEAQEQSLMGQIGHAIEPVIKPLGYDWRMGVGIMAGVGAKELMVTTLGVLYNSPEEDSEVGSAEEASQTRLASALQTHTTPEAALSYMVFALLYFPCLATIAAIAGESGKWKWALITAGYTTGLAYVVAFLVYRLALFF